MALERIDAIDQLLPQTQCERCGYPGCKPYAQAIADGMAEINRCPPGGDETIAALAQLLGRTAPPLAAELAPMDPTAVADIDESRCIGCALCLPACPVDAIVGAATYMHTVVANQCSGCELCIPVCPVDCISMVGGVRSPMRVDADRAAVWRRRFARHQERASEAARAAEARRRRRRDRTDTRRAWDDA
jgi:electron transport complex protein RnfB